MLLYKLVQTHTRINASIKLSPLMAAADDSRHQLQ